jgi:hypothetical protein
MGSMVFQLGLRGHATSRPAALPSLDELDWKAVEIFRQTTTSFDTLGMIGPIIVLSVLAMN